jgi:hypothetical protein
MLYGGGCVFIVLIAQVKQSRDSLPVVSITVTLYGGGCIFIVLYRPPPVCLSVCLYIVFTYVT